MADGLHHTAPEPSRGVRYYRGLTHVAIRRPIGTLAITSVAIVLGFFFLGRLPVNLLPAVEYPMVSVTVNYPGVAPEVMEEQVTRVLERNLSATENLVGISSRASEGRTNVNLQFEYGVDLDIAMQNAARLLEQARQQLPQDIEPPRMSKWDPGEWPIWRAGLSSPSRTPREVRDWVEQRLLPQLQTIEGVATVEAVGGQIREVEVVLDQERMRLYGLSLTQIAEQLAAENVNVAAGNVTSERFDVIARTDGRFSSAQQIADVQLRIGDSNRRIRLGDIAEIRDGFREQRVFVRLDGTAATQLSVFKLPSANTVAVVDQVESTMRRLQASNFIPSDIVWTTTRDGSVFVRSSIEAVASAAWMGAALSMLVVLAFLGSVRKSLVIGVSIPLAVLTTLVLMGLGGLSLNVISLGGLALGVGLLLDNSIVMLENISRHQTKLGKPPDQAAHEGADEVISAIAAGTLTNLAAVLPFLFITGLAALIFRELILTISFAVLASLAVALTLVPTLAAQLGRWPWRSGLSGSRPFGAFNRGLDYITRGYQTALRHALRWRWLVMAGTVSLFVVSLQGMQRLGNEFLPQLDNGEVSVRGMLPSGSTPEVTNAAAREIAAVLASLPHVEMVFETVGGHFRGGTIQERPGSMNFDVNLSDPAQRPDWPAGRWVAEAQRTLNALDIPGARLFVRPPSIPGLTMGRSGSDVDIMVVGEELPVLDALARDLVAELDSIPGLVDIELGRDERTPLLSVDVDRERAAALGLNAGDIGRALRDAVTGAIPTRFQTGNAEYDVRVRLPRSTTGDPDALASVIVAETPAGQIQLRDVAQLRLGEGPAHIERENQVRVARITGNFNTTESDPGSILTALQQRVEDLNLPAQYGVIFGGQFETLAETDNEMVVLIGLALFLVLVVLTVQYERLSNPIVILTAAPLSIIGVIGILLLTGTALSAPVFLGVILLVGIVVNNAILLVEYIERARFDDQTLEAAILEAARVRLRPILMTTLTTIVGMAPLAIGMGAGANLMQPLAVGVIGGLISATLLTLFLIPCLYLSVNGLTRRLGRLMSTATPPNLRTDP